MKIYVIRIEVTRDTYRKYILAENALDAYRIASRSHDEEGSMTILEVFSTHQSMCFLTERIKSFS